MPVEPLKRYPSSNEERVEGFLQAFLGYPLPPSARGDFKQAYRDFKNSQRNENFA